MTIYGKAFSDKSFNDIPPMTTITLNFEFPGYLTANKFLSQLADKANFKPVSEHYTLISYYDSFDWRLYRDGIICEFNRSQTASILTLKNLHTGQLIASADLDSVPKFAKEFQPKNIRNVLAPLLEMRALLPLTTLEGTRKFVNVLNKDEKTVLKLMIDTFEYIPCRLQLTPIKGYDKAALKFIEDLIRIGLVESNLPPLIDALKTQGRKPKDYTSKLNIKLDPNMRSDLAVKYIFNDLLKAIKVNEQDTIAATDSEFLHDFRVAVRRTRAGLNQLKNVLPEAETARFSHFFAWLGQITTPTRDLDVYLLDFDHYKKSVPPALRENLNPLYDFIEHKQKQAQKNLASKLKSPDYIAPLIEWEEFLRSPTIKKPTQANALLPIKTLADNRILKVFRRIIKDGQRITDQSPPGELHDLRKTCKKLRYLMEFFQNLYPKSEIKSLIKSLKHFQDILGEFQDLEVQEITLKKFSEEMMNEGVPADTFLAMGVLIQTIDKRRQQAREAFQEKFDAFDQPDIQDAFHSLFGC
ncbi:CHAD domain containing protein [Methylotuvimicrobium alcaliphilum 20Z]|uniref:CHAD domain containing protein n=2 Tax=Methylotuvimicrobium alcaliphilum TaxID=271065 RepID=G4SWB0_META2|nr:CHAD domain containing protein [Methylotuvimicrobium alcaliphilum 20Z]